ncbi:aldehyde dehydrogenase family-domain-containing protein [Dipodascopsis uninucleata]
MDGLSISGLRAFLENKVIEISSQQLIWVGCLVVVTSALVYLNYSAENIPEFVCEFPEQSRSNWTCISAELEPAVVFDLEIPGLINCFCPATGQLIDRIQSHTESDIDKAIAKCKNAQKIWQLTSFKQRVRVLKCFLKFLKRNQEEIARIACRDSGKTMIDAGLGEIMVTLEKLCWTIKNGERALKSSKRVGPANLLIRYKSAEVVYEPLGVVLALVSWNYPLHNLLNPIISGLFSGNGTIVKCSEHVYWSSLQFISMFRNCIAACGFSPDIIQLICPVPEFIDYLTSHEEISHITFIGSKPIAHKVLNAASKSLTPVTVELGGKDAAIVLNEYQEDWDQCDGLSSVLMRGTFQSSGQNCIGIERIIAEPKAYSALLQSLPNRVKSLRLGSILDDNTALDMGAMINPNRFKEIEDLISDAVKDGATLVCGGRRYLHPKHPKGFYFEPTLLADVTSEMRIAKLELFAPVMVLMRASNIEDVIKIVNSDRFGLGGSVFGKRGSFATERVAKEMRTGNVAINDFATFYVCQLPFGGVDDSGYGKFGGEEGLRSLCLAKSICRDRYPLIKTVIPAILDYPIKSVNKAWSFVELLNIVSYATSISEFLSSIVSLAKNSM